MVPFVQYRKGKSKLEWRNADSDRLETELVVILSTKENEETFWMVATFYMLIKSVHTFIKTHQTVFLKWVHLDHI